MKLRHLVNPSINEGRIIAQFGRATLVRQRDGKWRLNGGSVEDRSTAREWISLFRHEVVLQRD